MQHPRPSRVALAAALALAACGSDNNSSNAFTLSSPDVPAGGTFSTAQVSNALGCTGGNTSPALNWANPPAGTQSFAVTIFDSDAPTGSGFWHWTVFNIPASARSLASNAGVPGNGTAPAGAVQGYTDFGKSGYGGPCPPEGDAPHHYTFTVYALKVPDLGLTPGAPGALVAFNAKGNALASASFQATYSRPGSPTSHPDIPTAQGFTLTSAEIVDGGIIANDQVLNGFGCSGNNASPSLTWSVGPTGTQSYLLTLFDSDAPTGSGFWHWLVFNLPASTLSLPKGAGSAGAAPGGGVQAYTDFGVSAYGGPCPPVGDPPHHYHFTVYAMPVTDLTTLGLGPGATGSFVGFVTRASPARALAKAELTATYGR
jgi:Raf kinase inhibitor-like YbhB/YbcL family protein